EPWWKVHRTTRDGIHGACRCATLVPAGMRRRHMRRFLAPLTIIVLIVGACSGGATPTPAGSTGTAPSVAPGGSVESTAPSTAAFDPKSITGTAKLSGWQSSDAENAALTATVAAFEAAYPNIKVDYKVTAGDYAAVMATNFSSKNVPDLFYVDATFAQPWREAGFPVPRRDSPATESCE